jgi:heme-degrading monooxygenase HmoA
MTVRVMVHTIIDPANCEAFEEAFLKVSEAVHGTPGHIGDELIRDTSEEATYVLLAEWETEQAFLDWVGDPRHLEASAPMYPFWQDGITDRRIYEVRAKLANQVAR